MIRRTLPLPEAFGVIWLDFIPLSLPFLSAAEAMAYADELKRRMSELGEHDKAATVKAVRVPEGTTKLEYL